MLRAASVRGTAIAGNWSLGNWSHSTLCRHLLQAEPLSVKTPTCQPPQAPLTFVLSSFVHSVRRPSTPCRLGRATQQGLLHGTTPGQLEQPEVRVQERYPLVVMGCTGVGKSALACRFIRLLRVLE